MVLRSVGGTQCQGCLETRVPKVWKLESKLKDEPIETVDVGRLDGVTVRLSVADAGSNDFENKWFEAVTLVFKSALEEGG